MTILRIFSKTLLLLLGCFCLDKAIGQMVVRGTIFDRTQQFPLPGVSVESTSGQRVKSDSLGRYTIRVKPSDSLFFSYLGKPTFKFPVKTIDNLDQFDMSLNVASESLPTVTVWPRNYYQDSIENRMEYQRVFDYGSGGIDNLKSNGRGGFGVGIDLASLFNGRQRRAMYDLQRMLLEEEREKYVDHRFTKKLVKQLTGMQSPALDSFMRIYRPSADFIQSFETEWEYFQYIQSAGRNFAEIWKEEHPSPPLPKTDSTRKP